MNFGAAFTPGHASLQQAGQHFAAVTPAEGGPIKKTLLENRQTDAIDKTAYPLPVISCPESLVALRSTGVPPSPTSLVALRETERLTKPARCGEPITNPRANFVSPAAAEGQLLSGRD